LPVPCALAGDQIAFGDVAMWGWFRRAVAIDLRLSTGTG